MIQLELRSHGQAVRQYRFEQEVVFIGRDPKNDVAFEDRSASRHHARLVRGADGYELEDLGSRNGTKVNERLAQRASLQAEDQIRIGAHTLVVLSLGPKEVGAGSAAAVDELDRTRVAVYADSDPDSALPPWDLVVERDGQLLANWPLNDERTGIGRDPSSDVVLADDDVSRHHARILRKHGKYYIEDLDSLNGTLVNGEPVYTSKLEPSTEIRIGPYRLRLIPASAEPGPISSGGPVECASCHRAMNEAWPACPFCEGEQRRPMQTSLVLEPLKAPDPAIGLLDSTVKLALTDETIASMRHLWVSFEEPDGSLHPVGQVPDLAPGCTACLFVPVRLPAPRICPNCASERLGSLELHSLLRGWMKRGSVSVTLARITPRIGSSALVQVALRCPESGSG